MEENNRIEEPENMYNRKYWNIISTVSGCNTRNKTKEPLGATVQKSQ